MTSDTPASNLARSVLFAHDGPVHIAPDGVPRGVHYTQALIRRYLMLGDCVTFMTRMVPIRQEVADAYSPLLQESFRFVPVPNVKSVRAMLRERHRAKRTIREEVSRCDVLVARLPSTIGRWAWSEAMRQQKPVLIEFMACTWDALWHNSLKAKLLAPYFLFQNRRLMRRASHALYVTDSFLQKRYPTAGKSIGCSNVIVESASEVTLQGRIARISSYGAGRKIVLATIAAVDVPYKNQMAVLRALKSMGSDRHRFLYRIIGPGDPAGLMVAADRLGVADQVEFVGALRHADIPGVLDGTDIYVQPSRTEGLPRALIEAMSRGCAALGSRRGGISELLEEQCLFEPQDVEGLTDLLLRWDPVTLERAAWRNTEAAARFTYEVLEARRAAFYSEFLADHGLAA